MLKFMKKVEHLIQVALFKGYFIIVGHLIGKTSIG